VSVGRLESLVLDELWARGEATVVQVHAALSRRRRVAPTTVSTILRRLEEKGIVTHRTEERRFVFRPLVQRRDLRRRMIGDLVDQLFGGSTAELMSHLVEDGEVDRGQLERLRRLVSERAPRARKRRG
jgi:predicted transcriptional regulator